MKKLLFNDNWLFCRGLDGAEEKITLPHDAMLGEERSETAPSGEAGCWIKGNKYVYIKRFVPEKDWADKKLILEFEGVYQRAKIYLNGEQVGAHDYGYTGFFIDITGLLTEGENELKVVADNSRQPNCRWYSGAGIYRPVWLYMSEEKYILPEGIKVKTLSIDPPAVKVSSCTSADGDVKFTILSGKKTIAKASAKAVDGAASAEIQLDECELWSPENPVLYTCEVEFAGDKASAEFGIRTVEVSAEKGLRINGKQTLLKGACIHHDNGLLGGCAYDFAEERRIRLLQKVGYNAIRCAHNPCSKAMLSACDRLGMLVMDEYIDGWYVHKNPYDYADLFEKNWKSDVADMINRDYNHPSVIMYSMGNEVGETASKKGIAISEEMTQLCHSLDDTRPVTCGINIFFNLLSSLGFGVTSDKKSNKLKADIEKAEKEGKPMKKKKAVGSEFFNQLAGKLGAKFMKFGASLHGSDVTTRKAFAKFDVAGYNYGIKRCKKDVKKYPKRIICGTETFSFDVCKFLNLAKEHPSIIGDFVWAGIDYLGECGVGAWEYSNYAPDFSHGYGWMTAGSGRLDLLGNETGEALYTRVAYGLDEIRMSVVPADTATEKHSPACWRITNARESWSWSGCEGKTTFVEVYTYAPQIALFVNGKKVGCKKRDKIDCRTVFKTKYYDGEVCAVGYDKNGKEICREKLVTAGKETMLTVSAENDVVGKNDLCYVHLCLTDEKGNVKPLERDEITVEVKGGELLAAGAACSYYPRGYLTDTADTYYGRAMAIVKPVSNKITVSGKSKFGTSKCVIEVKE